MIITRHTTFLGFRFGHLLDVYVDGKKHKRVFAIDLNDLSITEAWSPDDYPQTDYPWILAIDRFKPTEIHELGLFDYDGLTVRNRKPDQLELDIDIEEWVRMVSEL